MLARHVHSLVRVSRRDAPNHSRTTPKRRTHRQHQEHSERTHATGTPNDDALSESPSPLDEPHARTCSATTRAAGASCKFPQSAARSPASVMLGQTNAEANECHLPPAACWRATNWCWLVRAAVKRRPPKRTPMTRLAGPQIGWSVCCASTVTVSGSFYSSLEVLFTFRSRYFFAIGRGVVFSFSWRLPAVN